MMNLICPSTVLAALTIILSIITQKPPIESYIYKPEYKDYAQNNNQEAGIVVVAYNRPEYLIQVVESLEKNPESQTLPFFFMLDGGPNATQEENAQIIENSTIKHKYIIERDHNYGCPKNLIDARRFMFDWCNFEKVIVIEDDIIVTPQYLGLLLRLHNWATANYENVGVVQAWTYCYMTKEEKESHLNSVKYYEKEFWSFVSYCIDKKAWGKIKPIMYAYEQFIDAIPNNNDHNTERSKPKFSWIPNIRAFIQTLAETKMPCPSQKNYICPSPSNAAFLQSFFTSDSFEPHQDYMTAFSLWMANIAKIQTVVNRAKHIGAHGITINEEQYHNIYDKISLDSFESDKYISEFIKV